VSKKLLFFQALAPVYDFFHFSPKGKTLRNIEVELNLSPKDLLLDLAGGTGRISQNLKRLVRKVFVVDASRNMLRIAKRRGLDGKYGFAEKIPFPNSYFDKVIVVDAFHHFDNPEQAIREIKRVLKKNGVFLLQEVNPRGPFGFLLKWAEKFMLMESCFYKPAEMDRLISREFFSIEMQKINANFFSVVARK